MPEAHLPTELLPNLPKENACIHTWSPLINGCRLCFACNKQEDTRGYRSTSEILQKRPRTFHNGLTLDEMKQFMVAQGKYHLSKLKVHSIVGKALIINDFFAFWKVVVTPDAGSFWLGINSQRKFFGPFRSIFDIAEKVPTLVSAGLREGNLAPIRDVFSEDVFLEQISTRFETVDYVNRLVEVRDLSEQETSQIAKTYHVYKIQIGNDATFFIIKRFFMWQKRSEFQRFALLETMDEALNLIFNLREMEGWIRPFYVEECHPYRMHHCEDDLEVDLSPYFEQPSPQSGFELNVCGP